MSIQYLGYHLVFAGIILLLAQSLNLIWKVNIFSLGHHGFFCIFAYSAAIFTRLAVGADLQWTIGSTTDRIIGFAILLCSIAFAALITTVVGFMISLKLLKLRDDYLAVATLVFAEAVWIIMSNWEYVGGSLGIEMPYLVFTNSSSELTSFLAFFMVIVMGLNILLYYCIRKLHNSIYGLYIQAIKDDELASSLSGVNVTTVRNRVFVFGAFVAGTAGAIFIHFVSIIIPTDFNFINGLPIILYVVLGNLGINSCILATFLVYSTYEIIKLQFFGVFGDTVGQVALSWKESFYACFLILIIIIRAVLQKRNIKFSFNFCKKVAGSKPDKC